MGASEKEMLQTFQRSVYKIGEGLKYKKFTLDEIGEYVPGLLHLNNQHDLQMTYLTQAAERWAGYQLKDIIAMGPKYFANHIEPNTWKVISKRFLEFAQQSDESKIHSSLFYYRRAMDQPYQPMFTNFKVLPDSDQTLSITTPLDILELTSRKVARLIEQGDFYVRHFLTFSSLTKREVEVLSLLAQGYTNKDISDSLTISLHTVRTHRNRIYKKLDIKHFRDVIKYAHAFDLI